MMEILAFLKNPLELRDGEIHTKMGKNAPPLLTNFALCHIPSDTYCRMANKVLRNSLTKARYAAPKGFAYF